MLKPMVVRVILLLVSLCCARPLFSFAQTTSAVASPLDKRALILVSSAYGGAGVDGYVAGLVKGLKAGGLKGSDINVEYLDLLRRGGEGLRQPLAKLLKDKYANANIDVIFCVQQAALNFLLNEGEGLAASAPVFARDAKLPHDARLGAHQFVLQETQLDYAGTLQRALELFPRTKQVLVLQGSSELELVREEAIRTDLAPWQGKLQIENTRSLSFDEIDAKVAGLPRDSIIVGVGITRDARGNVFVPLESNARILRFAQAPVFVLYDTSMGTGSIGGMIARLGDDAALSSVAAIDVLRGTKKLTERVLVEPGHSVSMFDWKQLERWGADPAVLPRDTVFINKPRTLWGDYRTDVILGGLALVALLSLVIALVFQNRRRAMAEARFRVLVEQAPEAILVMDTDLHVAVDANPSAERLFGCPREELLGSSLSRFYSPKQPDGRSLRDSMRQNIANVMAGEALGVERAITTVDGREIICDVRMVRLPAVDRQLLRASFIDVTERKLAEERIHTLAFFDQLTGLPNRTLLLDRLRQTIAASSRVGSHAALLVIDLDNFKTLNDTLGHDVGDLLLKEVGHRLTCCVRECDTVARVGGDEFVVVLAGLSNNESEAVAGIETVAGKIIASLNETYLLDKVAHRSTASIGVTLFCGDASSVDDLMKQGDLAMYKSKEAGRNTWRFFDPNMESVVKLRVALEEDLRHALNEQQFLLHYQAQVLGDGRVTGAEVLVRWQHPERGLVPPLDFISLAEDTGLILPLGNWVLETACKQLAAWARRADMAHLTVAVNVSAHQFHQTDFVDQILGVLKRTGANPQRLKLELTESLLVENVEEIIEKMFALKARGVGFSLDDFGTGYSSLSYLKRLPLDQLKIDRSFVLDVLSDPNDAAIAKTIVALAHSLGLGVIAEGVETVEQKDFLASAGCYAYQGYYFSRPLPIEGFEAFALRAQSANQHS